MGLAASQARLLFITARKSDVEFSEMKCATNKMSLAREAQDLSEEYNRSLNMRKLTFAVDGGEVGSNSVDLSYDLLMNPNSTNLASQYMLTDLNNRVILSDSYASKLGLSGDSGGIGSLDRTAFLSKFGIVAADYPEPNYDTGGTAGAGGTDGTGGVGIATNTLNENMNIMANLMNESNFSKQKASVLSESVYVQMKPVLADIDKNIKAALKSTTLTASQKDIYKRMQTNITVAQKALELAHTANISTNDGWQQAVGSIATIKSLFAGTSFSDSIPGITVHKNTRENFKNIGGISFTRDSTNREGWALKFVDSKLWTNASGLENISQKTYNKNNMGDLTAALNASGAFNVTSESSSSSGSGGAVGSTGGITGQHQADFYTNLFYAIKANGWTKNANITNSKYLSNQIINGNIQLQKINSDGTWSRSDLSDPSSPLRNVRDTEGAEMAKAKYDMERDKLNDKDTELDLQMKNLETERSALDTEIDSVKSIITKNIERSFKTFA